MSESQHAQQTFSMTDLQKGFVHVETATIERCARMLEKLAESGAKDGDLNDVATLIRAMRRVYRVEAS